MFVFIIKVKTKWREIEIGFFDTFVFSHYLNVSCMGEEEGFRRFKEQLSSILKFFLDNIIIPIWIAHYSIGSTFLHFHKSVFQTGDKTKYQTIDLPNNAVLEEIRHRFGLLLLKAFLGLLRFGFSFKEIAIYDEQIESCFNNKTSICIIFINIFS